MTIPSQALSAAAPSLPKLTRGFDAKKRKGGKGEKDEIQKEFRKRKLTERHGGPEKGRVTSYYGTVIAKAR